VTTQRTENLLAAMASLKLRETVTVHKAIVLTDPRDGSVSTHEVTATVVHHPDEWFHVVFDGPLPSPLARAIMELFASHGSEEVN
jgi:hypothetical protein